MMITKKNPIYQCQYNLHLPVGYRSVNHPILIFFLLALLALGTIGCDSKNADFFAPITPAELEREKDFPSISEIPGNWSIGYEWGDFTCEGDGEPYTVPATIEAVGLNLNVHFPDAPAPISGEYDPSNGWFWGTTGLLPFGDGYTIEEAWETMFFSEMEDVILLGISRVDVRNPQGDPYCFIEFDISGSSSISNRE